MYYDRLCYPQKNDRYVATEFKCQLEQLPNTRPDVELPRRNDRRARRFSAVRKWRPCAHEVESSAVPKKGITMPDGKKGESQLEGLALLVCIYPVAKYRGRL